MNALSNKDGIIAAAAMDQRGSLQKSLASAKGVDAKAITWDMMSEFKTAVTRILTPARFSDSARSGVRPGSGQGARVQCRVAARV